MTATTIHSKKEPYQRILEQSRAGIEAVRSGGALNGEADALRQLGDIFGNYAQAFATRTPYLTEPGAEELELALFAKHHPRVPHDIVARSFYATAWDLRGFADRPEPREADRLVGLIERLTEAHLRRVA